MFSVTVGFKVSATVRVKVRVQDSVKARVQVRVKVRGKVRVRNKIRIQPGKLGENLAMSCAGSSEDLKHRQFSHWV